MRVEILEDAVIRLPYFIKMAYNQEKLNSTLTTSQCYIAYVNVLGRRCYADKSNER